MLHDVAHGHAAAAAPRVDMLMTLMLMLVALTCHLPSAMPRVRVLMPTRKCDTSLRPSRARLARVASHM